MRVGRADKSCGTMVVAVHHGDGRQAAEAFEYHGPHDHLAAEAEFLAEGVRSGVDLTAQQRCQPSVTAVDHPFELTVQRAQERPRTRDRFRCVVLAAETECDV